jgi:hypothetical protein
MISRRRGFFEIGSLISAVAMDVTAGDDLN